jgi:RND family efflux transporter MFP subunit
LEVDCRLYEAQRDKVQIEKDIAQLELQNYEKLDKLRSTSKLEIEQSRAKYEKQKTELDIAQLNVDRCKIYAPFDGRVVTRKASVHQIVKPQEELFDIVSTKHLEVVAVIPSHWISKLKRWQKVSVHIDELDRTAYAFIKEIGAIVDTSSQTINVRLRFKSIQKNILAGMSATVNFN